MYEDLTLREHLELTARAYGIPEPLFRERMDFLLEEFQMADKTESFSFQMSKGMRQKVMIMNAFLIEPQLISSTSHSSALIRWPSDPCWN